MNRREFSRFNINLDVRYRILESLKPYKTTATEDMCERGIRICLPEYFEPETRLELTVHIPTEGQPIKAIGKIVWIKKDLFTDFFVAGISLVHIKAHDKDKFYKYALC